jgi:hypothetical protein
VRSHLIHRAARDIIPRPGGAGFPPIAFDPAQISSRCDFPGPPELGTVNPDAVHEHVSAGYKSQPHARRAALINIVALGVATSATLVVLYVLCAVVAMALPDIALSHAWLTLFTTAPIGSMWGLIEGIISSIVFGWVIALVLGSVYNWIAGRLT